MRYLLVTTLVLGACWSSSPPVAPPHTPVAHDPMRGRYVGLAIGYEIAHVGFRTGAESSLHLPDGMAKLSVMNLYDNDGDGTTSVTLARTGRELVVLVARDGVVTDDAAVAADGNFMLVNECSEQASLGLVRADGCSETAHDAPALAAWNLPTTKLVAVTTSIRCSCWWAE